MRSNEFITEEQELAEIERLSIGDYTGGKQYLHGLQYGKRVMKLPGGSGLLYSTSKGPWGEGIDIKLWDPKGREYLAAKANKANEPQPARKYSAPGQLIGKLSVTDAKYFPLKGAVQVDTITIDEDYRGMGLATALYGIVLTIMKRPLIAGSSQTPGGRRNWVSLASIPGVQMKGYVLLASDELDPTAANKLNNPKAAAKNIDIIMGKLGGQHIGTDDSGFEYFAFDVKPNTTGKELEAYINTNLNKLYKFYVRSGDDRTGLYAIWTGQ